MGTAEEIFERTMETKMTHYDSVKFKASHSKLRCAIKTMIKIGQLEALEEASNLADSYCSKAGLGNSIRALKAKL